MCRFVQAEPSNSFKLSCMDADMPCTEHAHKIDTQINYSSNNGSFILSTAFKIAVTGTAGHRIASPSGGNVVQISPSDWSKYIFKQYTDYIPALHGPGENPSNKDHRVNVDLVIPSGVDFSMLPTKTCGVDCPDVYPAHVLLAVMVYIGRKDS